MTCENEADAIVVAFKAIPKEPRPLLLVLTLHQFFTVAAMGILRQQFEQMAKDRDLPPMVFLQPGQTIEAVLDSRHERDAMQAIGVCAKCQLPFRGFKAIYTPAGVVCEICHFEDEIKAIAQGD